MNNISIADELDQAVNQMLAGAETAVTGADLEMDELAGIALDLKDCPDPEFKALLKADLMRQTRVPAASQRGIGARPQREVELPPAVLPSLFGTNTGGYPIHQRSLAASLLAHVIVLGLVVVSGVWAARQYPTLRPVITASMISLADYPLPPAKGEAHGGGGSGASDKLKAPAGVPPRFSAEQFAPPQVVVQNPQPRLPIEPTVIGPPNVIFPKSQTGDLFSKLLIPSNGTGTGGGTGDSHGTGVGSGDGPGAGPGGGNIGGGVYS